MNKLNTLKYVLFFFFFVDILIFISSQLSPNLFVSVMPQFNVESINNSYPRLVGILFLMLGIVRLYGGLYIHDKGVFQLALISWVVEFVYVLIEIIRGQFVFQENILVFVACILMFTWSLLLYRKSIGTSLE